MSSHFNLKLKTKNKKQIADVKRVFRNSVNEDEKTVGINNFDYASDWTDINIHVETQNEYDYANDKVYITTSLIDETFVLTVKSENEYFGNAIDFSFFMDNEIRKEIIQKLSDVKIN